MLGFDRQKAKHASRRKGDGFPPCFAAENLGAYGVKDRYLAGMSRRLRVLLAEDQYLIREGTKTLLENEGSLDVVGVVAGYDLTPYSWTSRCLLATRPKASTRRTSSSGRCLAQAL